MRPVVLAVLTALAAGGCGRASADLFVVERTGTIPGARLTLLVGDGGTVACDRRAPREITSEQLIEARSIVRDLAGEEAKPGPARRGVELPPGPGAIMRYDVRAESGSVAFSDTSRDQPPVFFAIAKLTRDLARNVCGLPR